MGGRVYQVAIEYGKLSRKKNLTVNRHHKLNMSSYFVTNNTVRFFSVCDKLKPVIECHPVQRSTKRCSQRYMGPRDPGHMIMVEPGDNISVPCYAMGSQYLTVNWFTPGNAALSHDKGYLNNTAVLYKTMSWLNITNMTVNQQGRYTCRAANINYSLAGFATMKLFITIDGAPLLDYDPDSTIGPLTTQDFHPLVTETLAKSVTKTVTKSIKPVSVPDPLDNLTIPKESVPPEEPINPTGEQLETNSRGGTGDQLSSTAKTPLILYITGLVIFSALLTAICIIAGVWSGPLRRPGRSWRTSQARKRLLAAVQRLPRPPLPPPSFSRQETETTLASSEPGHVPIYDTLEGVEDEGEYSYAWNVPDEVLKKRIPLEMSITAADVVEEEEEDQEEALLSHGGGSSASGSFLTPSRSSRPSLSCPDPATRGSVLEMRAYANRASRTLPNPRADSTGSSAVPLYNVQSLMRDGAAPQVRSGNGSGARTRIATTKMTSVYIQSSELLPTLEDEDGEYVRSDRISVGAVRSDRITVGDVDQRSRDGDVEVEILLKKLDS